jgi:hypothetical protein
MLAKSPETTSRAQPRREDGPLHARDADPEGVLQEILSYLGEVRFRAAQRLAGEAAVRFPAHAGIRRMNRALNEWQVRTRPATGRDTTEELDWMRNPPASARGKWVALIGSEMIAVSEDPVELMESLRSKNLPKNPLVIRVD